MKALTAIKILIDSDVRFMALSKYGILNRVSDEKIIKRMFKISFGYELNLENPKTFNEKLQWLKLHNRRSSYSVMVDKYEAKNYVASIIGQEHIIPTLGVWDKAEDINFDLLPNQFVLKCTHDSHGLFICHDKNKIDINAVRKKLNKCLHQNYYLRFREWPYKDVKPRIIAEKYMEDTSTSELRDYKFFCFNGVVKCYKVDFDRFISHHANYFDPDGNILKIGEEVCPPDFEKDIPAPQNLGKMKKLAEELTKNQPFLRADFYDVDGEIYFGELTFYPASGFGKFIYEGNDELLGSWIKLPESCGGGYSIIFENIFCVLRSSRNTELSDYKIHCFNGVPKVILVCRDRFSGAGLTEDFFDTEWHHLKVRREKHGNAECEIEKPKELDEMLELAQRLSVDIPFLRTDFYTINGRVYFGELTFYPASGFEKFMPEEFDHEMGSWIQLPEKC